MNNATLNVMETFITDLDSFEDYILEIRNTGIPKFFNKDLLEKIGITNPNSVFYVKLFRLLGLVDDEGRPTEEYSRFIQSDESARIVFAEKIKQCYEEVYRIEKHAHTLSKEKARDIFTRLLRGQKSETFIRMISDTYKTVSEFADFKGAEERSVSKVRAVKKQEKSVINSSSHVEFIMELMNDSEHIYRKDQLSAEDKSTENFEKLKSEPQIKNIDSAKELGEGTLSKQTVKSPVSGTDLTTKQDEVLAKVLKRKASLLQKLERYEEAVSTFDQILHRCQQSTRFGEFTNIYETYLRKAELLEKLKDYDRALGTYDKYLQLVVPADTPQLQKMA